MVLRIPNYRNLEKRLKIAAAVLIVAASFYAGHFHGTPLVRFAGESIASACRMPPIKTVGALAAWLCSGAEARPPGHFARSSSNRKVVVFVHGILGTSSDTWTYTNGGTPIYWPDLVTQDKRLDGYDVFVTSYYTPHLGSAPNIFQLSAQLVQDLEANGILAKDGATAKYTEIVFICHSMGNLIVRTAMLTRPAMSELTPLILSYAAPSEGSELAEVMQNNTPQFRDLVAIHSNSFLALLNTVWQNRAFDTEIACAYETRAYPGLGRLIVEKKSATGVCTRADPAGLDYDHASIVKPDGLDHPAHTWLVAHMTSPRVQKGWELPRWRHNQIVIGAKDHLESNIHAAMMTLVLRDTLPHLDIAPQYFGGHASRIFNRLKDRKIDLYPEYDGTLMHEYLGEDLPGPHDAGGARPFPAGEINRRLSLDPRTSSMRMMAHLGFHNPYVVVADRAQAKRLGLLVADGSIALSRLTNLSDRRLTVIADQEFQFRRDGWIGLRERYDLRHAQYVQAGHAVVYQRVSAAGQTSNSLVVGIGFGTDAELHAPDSKYIVLEDDKAAFPYYHSAPLADARALRRFPGIEPALASLAGIMSAKDMSELITTVGHLRADHSWLPAEHQGELLEDAVRTFLVKKGVLRAVPHPSIADAARTVPSLP